MARNVSKELSFVLPDESGSTTTLHGYWGQNIYLKLPNVTLHDVDYISVWSAKDNKDYGVIAIPHPIKVPDKTDLEEDVSCKNSSCFCYKTSFI